MGSEPWRQSSSSAPSGGHWHPAGTQPALPPAAWPPVPHVCYDPAGGVMVKDTASVSTLSGQSCSFSQFLSRICRKAECDESPRCAIPPAAETNINYRDSVDRDRASSLAPRHAHTLRCSVCVLWFQ
ncbi:hypothetical protein GN956_G26790 [Arapaima gigas]